MRMQLRACILPVWAILGANTAQPPQCGDSSEESVPASSLLQRRSLLSSRRPLLLLEGAQDMIYNHLAKTGGKFVKSVLAAAVEPSSLVLQNEGRSLEEVGFPENPSFTVGAIRHPCEYYVSLWANDHYPALRGAPELRITGKAPHTDAENVQRFRKFVRFASAGKIGAMTFRFLFSYAALPPVPKQNFHLTSARKYFEELMSEEEREAALRSYEQFDPNTVDCWIHTEKLEETLRGCILQYEQQGGLVDHASLEAAILESDHNPSDHGTCSSYYDAATEAFVRAQDARIFQMFNFKSCCGH